MAVTANADDYAWDRQNIFFSGVTPDLDGQCVSLVKWFLQDMTAVPNPQAARGDARYVGKNLVAQGHAVEVPYSQRQRGDVICYEYGIYGHIAVQLSDGRVFEENVNWPGVASEIVDGARVYASRIGSETESWRHDAHVYRINSYTEGGYMGFNYNSAPTSDQKGEFIFRYRGSPATPAEINNSSQPWGELNGVMLNEVFVNKNKEITDLTNANTTLQSALNAERNDPDAQFNILGRALAAMLTKLGYKKG